MSSENLKNGEKKTLTDDECFEKYKKEFLLKGHIAVNIEMVKSGIRNEVQAFRSIRRHFRLAGFK